MPVGQNRQREERGPTGGPVEPDLSPTTREENYEPGNGSSRGRPEWVRRPSAGTVQREHGLVDIQWHNSGLEEGTGSREHAPSPVDHPWPTPYEEERCDPIFTLSSS